MRYNVIDHPEKYNSNNESKALQLNDIILKNHKKIDYLLGRKYQLEMDVKILESKVKHEKSMAKVFLYVNMMFFGALIIEWFI